MFLYVYRGFPTAVAIIATLVICQVSGQDGVVAENSTKLDEPVAVESTEPMTSPAEAIPETTTAAATTTTKPAFTLNIVPSMPELVKISGQSFPIRCEADTEFTDQDSITWYFNGVEVDFSDKSMKRYRRPKASILVLRKTRVDQSGTYMCEARKGETRFDKSINVSIIEDIVLTSSEKDVPVIEGEQTSITCSAEGEPPPSITFSTLEDAPLPDSYFKIIPEDPTRIRVLSPHRDSEFNRIKCNAMQELPDIKRINAKSKIIHIDVEYKPEFNVDSPQVLYGIRSRNITLECNVKAANPNVSSMEFFYNTDIITNTPGKYELNVDLPAQKASLKILDLDDDAFGNGKFSCRAINSPSSATGVSLDYNIIEMLRPGQMLTALQTHTPTSVTLELSDPNKTGGDGVPILKYTVEWRKYENSTNEISMEVSSVDVPRTGSPTVHTVSNLDPETKYVFTMTAHNEAGAGEPFPNFVVTTKEDIPEPSSAPMTLPSSSLFLFLVATFASIFADL